MSSSEVLFILAFIVLPTAVLVSSIWAILFVRRRPDRALTEPPAETSSRNTFGRDSESRDTEVLAVIATSDEQSYIDTDGVDTYFQTEEVLETVDDVDRDEVSAASSDDETQVEDDLQEEPDERESAIPQTTEDLNTIVAEVTIIEPDVELPEPERETATEIEPGPELPIYETAELPVVEERQAALEKPQPAVKDEAQQRETEGESTPAPGRRKRSKPLRPADPDAPRGRGRSRDPQRQVPQLGRFPRRRDGSHGDTPPHRDSDSSH